MRYRILHPGRRFVVVNGKQMIRMLKKGEYVRLKIIKGK